MIRLGLIGCGRIAEKHASSMAKCARVELAALSDLSTDRMELVARKYADLRKVPSTTIAAYSSPDCLLMDPRLDAVVIATPSFDHARWAIAALHAGKHVLLEKPMSLTLRDADEIAELADNNRLRVSLCHQLRHRPLLKLAKSWIDQGRLGVIRSGSVAIRLNRAPAYYAASPWRGTWEQDGGMLLNQGIHLIDLLLWLIGERAESVYGLLGWSAGRKQTEDIAAGTIRFANGAIGIVEATTLSKPNNLDQSLTLFGDQGTISIGGADFSEVRRWHADGFASPAFPLVDMEEHAALYESFVDAVQGLPRSSLSTVTAKEARLSLEVAFALYESARIGQPVHLPLASFDTRLMSAPMEKRSEESER